jgi:hypothetical protein
MNRVFLLWASIKLPGLIQPEQQSTVVNEVLSNQQVDGGWRPASLTWRWTGWNLHGFVNMLLREDGTPMDSNSDGVATGLATLALQEADAPRDNVQFKHRLLAVQQPESCGGFLACLVCKRATI